LGLTEWVCYRRKYKVYIMIYNMSIYYLLVVALLAPVNLSKPRTAKKTNITSITKQTRKISHTTKRRKEKPRAHRKTRKTQDRQQKLRATNKRNINIKRNSNKRTSHIHKQSSKNRTTTKRKQKRLPTPSPILLWQLEIINTDPALSPR